MSRVDKYEEDVVNLFRNDVEEFKTNYKLVIRFLDTLLMKFLQGKNIRKFIRNLAIIKPSLYRLIRYILIANTEDICNLANNAKIDESTLRKLLELKRRYDAIKQEFKVVEMELLFNALNVWTNLESSYCVVSDKLVVDLRLYSGNRLILRMRSPAEDVCKLAYSLIASVLKSFEKVKHIIDEETLDSLRSIMEDISQVVGKVLKTIDEVKSSRKGG